MTRIVSTTILVLLAGALAPPTFGGAAPVPDAASAIGAADTVHVAPPAGHRETPRATGDPDSLPRARPNDHRIPAGRSVDGELRVELVAVEAAWYPRGPDGPRIVTPAFAERGRAPQVPGPLIRTTVGTPVRVSVRNTLNRTVTVRGLVDRASMEVPEELPDGAEPGDPRFLFADSLVVPGSPLVLERGEPTEIVVHNRLDFPISVHWHGLEVRSVYDGVGHWSGRPGATRPPVAPGDSATVRITPPRAGSFIYHVHGEPGHELSQGLYGPFLVLPEGEAWERDRDRVFVLAARGAERDPPPVVNGDESPPPERFAPGADYRLRFIHISPDAFGKRVRLLRNGELEKWRPLAKDGAEIVLVVFGRRLRRSPEGGAGGSPSGRQPPPGP